MKRLLWLLVVSLGGSIAGSAMRQLVQARVSPDAESEELVIAAHPVAVAAGVVGGLVFGGRGTIAAFLVSANVSANVDSRIIGEMIAKAGNQPR